MELAGLDLYRYDLPLVTPVALKGTSIEARRGLLVRLTTADGSAGWGEAAPLPGFSRETLEEAGDQLLALAPRIPGTRVNAGRFPPTFSEDPELFPSTRFALETAVWNLLAQAGEDPLSSVTGDLRTRIPANGLISGSEKEALENAVWMREAGYRAVKLKVGGAEEAAADARLVRGVGRVLGGGVDLRLDANRAWDFGSAVAFGRAVAGVGVEYVEEPLAEPRRLAELAGVWGLPVALDESLVGLRPGALGGHGYARAIVLKPTILGGISRILAYAERARSMGIEPVLSSSYESGVGTAAIVALAAAVGNRPAGLDTYRRLDGDVLRRALALPAPEVDVGRTTAAARDVDPDCLEPVGAT